MFPFTFRQIEVFLAICAAGSFRGAADRLDISEASVSDHVRALEAQLGCALFQRRRGASSTLSDKGILFRDGAMRMAALSEEMSRSLRSKPGEATILRLFVGPHILEDYVRPALSAFVRENPDLGFTFAAMESRAAACKAAVVEQIDGIVLSFSDETSIPGAVVLAHVDIGVFGSHDLLKRVEADGIGSIPFLNSPRGSEDEEVVLSNLKSIGVDTPHIAARYQYHDVGVGMALQGMGGLTTFQSIVDVFDPGAELCLLHRVSAWRRELYLRPGIDPGVASRVTDFFRAAAGPRRPLERRTATAAFSDPVHRQAETR